MDRATLESYQPKQFRGWLPQDHPLTDWRVVKPISLIRKRPPPVKFTQVEQTPTSSQLPAEGQPDVGGPRVKRRRRMGKRDDPTDALVMLRSMEVPLVLPEQRLGRPSRWWVWLLVSMVAIVTAPLIIVLGARQTALTVAKGLSEPRPVVASEPAPAPEEIPITITIRQPVDTETDEETALDEAAAEPEAARTEEMPALVVRRPRKTAKVRRLERRLKRSKRSKRSKRRRRARPRAAGGVDPDALLPPRPARGVDPDALLLAGAAGR